MHFNVLVSYLQVLSTFYKEEKTCYKSVTLAEKPQHVFLNLFFRTETGALA